MLLPHKWDLCFPCLLEERQKTTLVITKGYAFFAGAEHGEKATLPPLRLDMLEAKESGDSGLKQGMQGKYDQS